MRDALTQIPPHSAQLGEFKKRLESFDSCSLSYFLSSFPNPPGPSLFYSTGLTIIHVAEHLTSLLGPYIDALNT